MAVCIQMPHVINKHTSAHCNKHVGPTAWTAAHLLAQTFCTVGKAMDRAMDHSTIHEKHMQAGLFVECADIACCSTVHSFGGGHQHLGMTPCYIYRE